VNKDKRIAVALLADLCGAYSTQRTLPNKVLIILRDAVKDLADSEARSVKKMEPFKDNAGTAANYQNGLACWEDLARAQDALEEGEVDEAHPLLARVASGVVSPPEKLSPKLKRRIKKVK